MQLTDELETVIGYMKTHFDCPYCGYPDEREGDCSAEAVTCGNCLNSFIIRVVL
jgi:hypothetical protein